MRVSRLAATYYCARRTTQMPFAQSGNVASVSRHTTPPLLSFVGYIHSAREATRRYRASLVDGIMTLAVICNHRNYYQQIISQCVLECWAKYVSSWRQMHVDYAFSIPVRAEVMDPNTSTSLECDREFMLVDIKQERSNIWNSSF